MSWRANVLSLAWGFLRAFPDALRHSRPVESLGPHAALLAEIRELDRKDRRFGKIPETGRRIPEGRQNGSFTLLHGVWVEDSLYYEAYGIPLGTPPAGRDDVRDRDPGIPEQCFGRCGRCNVSWKWVEGHSTLYTDDSACFPLCEKCWSELTPEQRLPYYEELMSKWEADGSPKNPLEAAAIRTAVLNGE